MACFSVQLIQAEALRAPKAMLWLVMIVTSVDFLIAIGLELLVEFAEGTDPVGYGIG